MRYKKIFILGNGQSLKHLDIKKITKKDSLFFGSNLIFKSLKKVPLDYYFVNDINYALHKKYQDYSSDRHLKKSIVRVTGSELIKKLPHFSGKTVILPIKNKKTVDEKRTYFINGYSIVNLMFQFALTFKVEQIIFAGVDFRYLNQNSIQNNPMNHTHPYLHQQIETFLQCLNLAKKNDVSCLINTKESLLSIYLNSTTRFNKESN